MLIASAARQPSSAWSARTRIAQLRASGSGVVASLAYLLHSSGLLVDRARRSIWVHGEHPDQFVAALPWITEATRDRPNVRLVLTSTLPATVAYLHGAFPDDHAGPAPWDVALAIGRFTARLAPRLVVLLDGGRSFGARTLERICASRVPIAVVGVDRVEELADHLLRAAIAGGALRWVCASDDAAGRLRERGVPAASIAVIPANEETSDAGRDDAPRRMADALRDLLPDAPTTRPVEQSWRVPTLRDRAGASSAWKVASTVFAPGRIDDWPTLARRLGHPRSVLCLGNGPSSEDPAVVASAHDCLIRINWRWRERGLLTDPDLVFAGDPKTMHRVGRCVFGFWNIALERAMLMRRLVTRGIAPIDYLTLERLTPIIRDREWPARPTNGALAIVAAAALQPERLVIGGMDMFRHPDGRYPGDGSSRNAYSHVHREATDLAIVDLALAGFDGELVILSDIFRAALARYREQRGAAG